MTDETAQLRAQLAAAIAERNRLAAMPAVDAALAAVGVRPAFRKAVRALFLARRVELEDGEISIDGAPVEAVVHEWASTFEGKAHIGDDKDGPSAPGRTRRKSEMTRLEKAEYCRRFGVAAFEKLLR